MRFSRNALVACALVFQAATGCGEVRKETEDHGEFIGGPENEIVPDQYFVVLVENATEMDITDVEQQIVAQKGVARYRFQFLKGFVAYIPPAGVKPLLKHPKIEYIEADRKVYTASVQTCPPSWGLSRIDGRSLSRDDGVYSYDATGNGINVYVIDTGIEATDPDLGNRVKGGCTLVSMNNKLTCDPQTGKTPPDWQSDCTGHGTHIAGVVAGQEHGVAKRASLYSVRVLGCNGCNVLDKKSSGSEGEVVPGMEWVLAHHANSPAVAVLSAIVPDPNQSSATMKKLVSTSLADGIVYVVAAGNGSDDACFTIPARVGKSPPLEMDPVYQVITVGAFDATGRVSAFSNRGPCVDLFAPGEVITSIVPPGSSCPKKLWGTSVAAAHVAGVAALVLEKHPEAKNNTAVAIVRSEILGSATQGALKNFPIPNTPDRALYTPYNTGVTEMSDEDACDDGISLLVACRDGSKDCDFCGTPETPCCKGVKSCGKGGVHCNAGICQGCGLKDELCCGQSKLCAAEFACVEDRCVCGGAKQPCCAGGKCNTQYLQCVKATCEECGDETEVCCDGSKCNNDGLACIFNTKNARFECTACGDDGAPCCAGSKCNSNTNTLICNSTTKKCETCGLKDKQPCCGVGCISKNLTCLNGACAACGAASQPCCNGQCNPGALVCNSNNVCVPCGATAQACCTGGTCNPKLVCNTTNDTCEPCGLADQQPCCTGGCISQNLTCISGKCVTCGSTGQNCCNGGCNVSNLKCNTNNNKCEECGMQAGQACCSSGGVSGCISTNLQCVSGQCVACGGPGQDCCNGGCNASNLKCHFSTNKCVECGMQAGQVCCTSGGGSGCISTNLDCIGGYCQPCGLPGIGCCKSGTICGPGLACVGTNCQWCGGLNDYCCAGNQCTTPGTVCVTGKCHSCGGLNQPCCSGETCDFATGLVCEGGFCRDTGPCAARCVGTSGKSDACGSTTTTCPLAGPLGFQTRLKCIEAASAACTAGGICRIRWNGKYIVVGDNCCPNCMKDTDENP